MELKGKPNSCNLYLRKSVYWSLGMQRFHYHTQIPWRVRFPCGSRPHILSSAKIWCLVERRLTGHDGTKFYLIPPIKLLSFSQKLWLLWLPWVWVEGPSASLSWVDREVLPANRGCSPADCIESDHYCSLDWERRRYFQRPLHEEASHF